MTNVVECPICHAIHIKKPKRRFFRCCGVLHSVESNLKGSGIKRYEIRKVVPIVKGNDKVEIEFV